MSTTKRDYYEVLGVERDVQPDALKKAYRKLAGKYHPDRNQDDPTAEDKFKEVAEAYEILSDEDKRAAYDRYGHQGVSGAAGMGGGVNMNDAMDIFESLFGGRGGGGGGAGGSIFEDLFGGGGGGGGRSAGPDNRGSDLRHDLEIDFEEAVFGSNRDLSYSTLVDCGGCNGQGGEGKIACPACGGSGHTISSNGFFRMRQTCSSCGGDGSLIKDPCKECRGEGRKKSRLEFNLKIPPGVDTGMRLRVQGKGEGGRRGGPAGDLHVVIHVRAHKVFERDGSDLHCEVHVPVTKAALGGEIQVPTLEGSAKLKIPAGTESDKVFRLRNKGMPASRNFRQGDLNIHVKVEIPTKLSRDQKKLLEELARSLDESNYPAQQTLKAQVEGFYDRKKKLQDG